MLPRTYDAADARFVRQHETGVGRAGTHVRAAPERADRVLLPDARLAFRGGGRGAGHVHSRLAGLRAVRGPRGRALVAVPDRDERASRDAERQAAPRASDGPRPG